MEITKGWEQHRGQAPSLDDERCANTDEWNAGGMPGANVGRAESSSPPCYKQLFNLTLQPPFKHLHVLASVYLVSCFLKTGCRCNKELRVHTNLGNTKMNKEASPGAMSQEM